MKASITAYVPLTVGFVLSASLMCAIWRQVGGVAGMDGRNPITTVLLPAVLVTFAVLELTTVRRSLVIRQTPSRLPENFGAVVGSFGWGLDTGSMISTYRTSFATWGTLILSFANITMAPFLGLAYAVGFCVPLGLAIFIKSSPGQQPTRDFSMRINTQRRTMQIVATALLLPIAISLV